MPTYRQLLDYLGRPISSSTGACICVPCKPPSTCCLCDKFFAFAFTGDSGSFDPTGGQTAIVPGQLFTTCNPAGVYQFVGRTTIGGHKVCYSYWIPIFLACYDDPNVTAGTPGEIYLFYRAPNIVTAICETDATSTDLTAYFDWDGFNSVPVLAGHFTWDCSTGSWKGPVTISFPISWTDPCGGGTHTVTVTWTVEVAALDYVADPICGNVPTHANTFVLWCSSAPTTPCRFLGFGGFELLAPSGNVIEINSDAITSDETGICCTIPCVCNSLGGPPPPAPPPPDEANCCPGRTDFGRTVTATITGSPTVPDTAPGCDLCLDGSFPMAWTWDTGIGGKPGWIGFYHFAEPCSAGDFFNYRAIKLIIYCSDGVNWISLANFISTIPTEPDIFIETLLSVAPCTSGYPDNYAELGLTMNPGTNCAMGCPCYGAASVIMGA